MDGTAGKRVLITGASGLLGRVVSKAFKNGNWEVLGLAFSRAKDGLVKVDLTDAKQTNDVVKTFRPSLIVHCAAQRFPDQVEKHYEENYYLNVDVSGNLSKLAAEEGASFIFISTDYVFDGCNPPYEENDSVCPINKYGKTKADAEEAVMKANKDSIILRIPVLYGNEEYVAESAVSVLLEMLKSKVSKSVSDYEIRNPSHTDDIALICLQLAEKKLQDPSLSGVYQWCGHESLTKYAMLKIIANAFNLSYDHLMPDKNPSLGAPRPYNTQMCRHRLESLGIGHHTFFKDGVKSFKTLIESN